MRVLHVITGLGVGGAEDQVVQLASGSEHTVEVACLSEAGAAADRLRRAGVRVFSLPSSRQSDIAALIRLVRLMRSRRYDVVHAHLLRAGVYGQTAARMSGVPVVVYTEHTLGRRHIEELLPTAKVKALYKLNGRLADRVVAVSPWVQDRVVEWGVAPEKVTCVPNGLEIDKWRYDPQAREETRREFGIPSDANVICMVGRMIPRKQHLLLVRGVAQLVREGAWLLLIGDGPSRGAVEREVNRLGIATRAVLTGIRRDVPRILAGVDAFASLAIEEMFGLAPMEALASGLPVLVTHCPPLDAVAHPKVLWVTSDARDVEAAARHALAMGRSREAPTHLLAPYDSRHTTASTDALHAALLEQRIGARCEGVAASTVLA